MVPLGQGSATSTYRSGTQRPRGQDDDIPLAQNRNTFGPAKLLQYQHRCPRIVLELVDEHVIDALKAHLQHPHHSRDEIASIQTVDNELAAAINFKVRSSWC